MHSQSRRSFIWSCIAHSAQTSDDINDKPLPTRATRTPHHTKWGRRKTRTFTLQAKGDSWACVINPSYLAIMACGSCSLSMIKSMATLQFSKSRLNLIFRTIGNASIYAHSQRLHRPNYKTSYHHWPTAIQSKSMTVW